MQYSADRLSYCKKLFARLIVCGFCNLAKNFLFTKCSPQKVQGWLLTNCKIVTAKIFILNNVWNFRLQNFPIVLYTGRSHSHATAKNHRVSRSECSTTHNMQAMKSVMHVTFHASLCSKLQTHNNLLTMSFRNRKNMSSSPRLCDSRVWHTMLNLSSCNTYIACRTRQNKEISDTQCMCPRYKPKLTDRTCTVVDESSMGDVLSYNLNNLHKQWTLWRENFISLQ